MVFQFKEKDKKLKEFEKKGNFLLPYNVKYGIGKLYCKIIIEDLKRKKIHESSPLEIPNPKL